MSTDARSTRWTSRILRVTSEHRQVGRDSTPHRGPEDALDTACGLYLGGHAAWQPDPRRIYGDEPLARARKGNSMVYVLASLDLDVASQYCFIVTGAC